MLPQAEEWFSDNSQYYSLNIDTTKTQLEQDINEKGKKIVLLEEQLKEQDKRMDEVMNILEALRLEREIDALPSARPQVRGLLTKNSSDTAKTPGLNAPGSRNY